MLSLANNKIVTDYISKKGMTSGFARRFVAGETIEEAVKAVVDLNRKKIASILDYLGENVTDRAKAKEARDHYLSALDRIKENKINSSISVKLTQLGLDIDEALCKRYIETIVAQAERYGNSTEIDMEDSHYTERTLTIFKELRKTHENIRVCIQAYLYRSEKDLSDLNAMRAKVRLCKGAYNEPDTVAFQDKRDVDWNYRNLTRLLLAAGTHPAIATHDESMIRYAKTCVKEMGVRPEAFEFQMLYGIRRDLQEKLSNEGYPMRVYVPYGKEWAPYFMRRLAERPANTWFVIRNLVRES